MYILLALDRVLEEKILLYLNNEETVSCPTIMRFVSSDIPSDAIVITKASLKNHKRIIEAAGRNVSVIALYDESEENCRLEPLMTAAYTVFIPYSFTDKQMMDAIMKAKAHNAVIGTSAELIIGSSPIMQRTRSMIEKAMKSKLPVHIVGETGTGKTLAAEIIHRYSVKKKEIVRIECGQLSSTLAESILFGHTKGAYSGAIDERNGLIALADKSSLFLDEIQDLSLEAQGKLLSVLETGFYRHLGSDKPMHSSFRLITAGNVPLSELVLDNRMRKDFFHRINYIEIRMPSLSEHMEDIPELISKCEMDNGYLSEPIIDYTPFRHKFPGNVRELYRDVRLFHEGLHTLGSLPED